jgi:hypothetical protein
MQIGTAKQQGLLQLIKRQVCRGSLSSFLHILKLIVAHVATSKQSKPSRTTARPVVDDQENDIEGFFFPLLFFFFSLSLT